MHGAVCPVSETHACWRDLCVKPASGFLTVDISMLRIDADPIEATACYCSGLIATGEHLPRTESQARACFERFLKSIGSLHFGHADSDTSRRRQLSFKSCLMGCCKEDEAATK
jgi:hypothetical protein